MIRYANPALLLLTIVVAIAVAVGRVNQNIFFLCLLTAAFTLIISGLGQTSAKLSAFTIFCALAAAPIDVQPPAVVAKYDEPHRLDVRQSLALDFELRDIRDHIRMCGTLPAKIVVEGRNLAALKIEMTGAQLISATVGRFYDEEKLVIDFHLPATAPDMPILGLRLTGIGPEPALIRRGPEADGYTIYPESVRVEFNNTECRVLYHASAAPNLL